ncbi:O-antigen ligase family protein [Labedella gwakjiensis]|uniref:O-antigen ligase-related domain-containing protein n=2 Tax=Labedella gwakjiensis TaxID=390269 RepID=A0ABY0CAS0_9MICO|nr:O-antigen ligase family protein [Labedella gwakjiensis]RUQ86619.1 hypothetical protein ELQ93_06485 [Labedella gwakjiensis]
MKLGRLALYGSATIATIAATFLAIEAPVALAVLFGVCVALITVLKLGIRNGFIVLGILTVGFSAFLGRYASGVEELNSVGTALLILAGCASFKRPGLDRRVIIPGALFLVLAVVMAGVSLAATMNVEFSLRGLVGLVAAPLTVVAVTASLSHTPDHEVPRARKFILGAIASVVLVNIVVGLRQAIFGLSAEEIRSATEGLSTYSVGDQIRLMGTFQSNQDMGLFLACMAPALLVAGLRASGRAKAGFFVVATLLYVVNFLSLTRTSLIAGVTVGLLALAIWSRGEFVLRVLRNLLVVLAGTAIFVSVLIALGVPRVQAAVDRALTLTNLDADGSFNSRRDATLPIAWNAFTSHPLGAGAGAAGPVSQQFAEVAPLGYLNADNGYLMIGLQMGFLGLAILIWMLLAVVVSLGRRGTALRTAGAAAALALAVAMLTAGYWSLLAPICIVAAVVGVAMSEPREPRSERGGLVSVDRSRTHSRQAIDA